jgi:hypothetical protein
VKAKSHYPLKGEIEYFNRAGERGYSPSGVLRAMAMHIDGVTADRDRRRTVEGVMVYPNEHGWAATVLYQDVDEMEYVNTV